MNARLMTCLVCGMFLGPAVTMAQDSDADRSHPKAFVKDSAITTGFQLGILVVGVTPDSSPMLAAPAATEPSPVSRSNQGRESSID
jgi:hypothetical protein